MPEATTTECPGCHAVLDRGAPACTHCGAPLLPDPARQPEGDPIREPEERTHKWRWTLAGALYGLALRAVFGLAPAATHGAMSPAFLLGTPFVVGAIAAYGSPAVRRSLWNALAVPMLPMAMMLLGTAITMLEGSICIAIMSPLFFAEAALGGLCMGIAMRLVRVARSGVGALAAVPLLLMAVDPGRLPDSFNELRESVVVQAPPERVWAQIVTAKDIQASELPLSLVHLIGVPRPVQAENRITPDGEVRYSQWEHGVHFTARIVEQHVGRTITWRYSFGPDSFPAGTMDEHVALGGQYLDLGDTTFNLRPLAGGQTLLEVVGRYRLTTTINFYAIPVSRILGTDFLRTLLGFYKHRAEQA